MKKILLSLLVLPALLTAQNKAPEALTPQDTFNFYKYPAITLGAGVTGFIGDYTQAKVFELGRHRTSINVGIEQRLIKTLGLSANFMYGGVSANERVTEAPRNFGSTVMAGDLRAMFYFDNGWLLKFKSRFAPYLFGGVGYQMFDPKTDATDANGVAYNYWTDGTVRNLPQLQTNLGIAQIINRDYNYETAITTPGLAKNSLIIPFGAGLRYKLAGMLDAFVQGTYFMTMTDDMDGVKAEGNDAYLNVSAGIQVRIGKGPKDPNKERFKGVDYKEIERTDSDEDGVRDLIDKCPNTPKGVTVTKEGCPENITDADNDGILDFEDKETNTPAGAIVGPDGKQIPDAVFEKQGNDTIAVPRNARKNFPSSLPEKVKVNYQGLPENKINPPVQPSSGSGNGGNIDKSPSNVETAPKTVVPIPTKYVGVDTNADGVVDAKEIARVVDEFYDGKSKYTIDEIYELIDFYYDNN